MTGARFWIAVGLLGAGATAVLAGTQGPTQINAGNTTRTMMDDVQPQAHNSNADKDQTQSAKSSSITEAFAWVHPKYRPANWRGTCTPGNFVTKFAPRYRKHAKKDNGAYGSYNASLNQDDPTLASKAPGNYIFNFPSHIFKGSGTPPAHPDIEDSLRRTSNSYWSDDPAVLHDNVRDFGVILVGTTSTVSQNAGTWTYTWKIINNQAEAYSFEWPSVRAADVNGWLGTIDANTELTLVRTSTAGPEVNVGMMTMTRSGGPGPYWEMGTHTYYPGDLSHPTAVSNLSGTVAGDTVTLTWTNTGTYDKLYVYLDEGPGVPEGEVVAELSGTATSVEHETTYTGNLKYIVHAVKDWLPSSDTIATVSK